MTFPAPPLYARGVSRPSTPESSPDHLPTLGLLLGLIITLSAVVAYSGYITWQVTGLRKLQTDMVDRNRKDSLQLLRIQNDLNSLAVAMRDMVSGDEPYPLTAWSAQFQRVRTDLDDAIRPFRGHRDAAMRRPTGVDRIEQHVGQRSCEGVMVPGHEWQAVVDLQGERHLFRDRAARHVPHHLGDVDVRRRSFG